MILHLQKLFGERLFPDEGELTVWLIRVYNFCISLLPVTLSTVVYTLVYLGLRGFPIDYWNNLPVKLFLFSMSAYLALQYVIGSITLHTAVGGKDAAGRNPSVNLYWGIGANSILVVVGVLLGFYGPSTGLLCNTFNVLRPLQEQFGVHVTCIDSDLEVGIRGVLPLVTGIASSLISCFLFSVHPHSVSQTRKLSNGRKVWFRSYLRPCYTSESIKLRYRISMRTIERSDSVETKWRRKN